MHPVLSGARTLGAVLTLAGLSYGGYRYAVTFGSLDPFAKFRGIQNLNMEAGIQLDKVDLKAFHLGKLVARATVGTVTVTQDRNDLEMTGISDGVYRGSSNFRFASARGSYTIPIQQLQLRGGADVSGKDFSLHTERATFDKNSEQLTVPSKITGKLFGGNLIAADFNYSARSGDASGHYALWQGKPAVGGSGGPEDEVISRAWNIEGDGWRVQHGVWVCDNAKATDGEVLIYAPKSQWDRKADVLTATGRISYFSGKADVIADKVVVYKKEKRAVFTGNVVMLVKSKKDQDKPPAKEDVPAVKAEAFNEKLKLPDHQSVLTEADKKKADDLRSGKNLRDYPLHLQAQEITYWYGKGARHASFSGSPVAKQDFPTGQWRMGWSHDGTYDGEKELLHLTSETAKREVRYKNSMGDMALASKAEFSTKEAATENDEDLQLWDVSGIFTDTSGEDTRPAKDKTAAATGGPAHGGAPSTGTTTAPPIKHGSPR